MDLFSPILKKYSLHFPHLPLPCIIENEGSYNVFIFDIEVEITQPDELELLIEQIIKKMTLLYDERQKLSDQDRNIKTVEYKKTDRNITKTSVNKRRNSRNIENNGNNAKSARGKMKIKNIQNNRYVPTFSEDVSGNKNNILSEPSELFSDKITKYCHSRNIAYPEYVFEKSNGVYLCKALFLKEKFESRYAYDMSAAREDASGLIYSYIKFLEAGDEESKRKCNTVIQKEKGTPELPRNTNYSDIYNNTEKDDTFDIGNFFSI